LPYCVTFQPLAAPLEGLDPPLGPRGRSALRAVRFAGVLALKIPYPLLLYTPRPLHPQSESA